MTELKYNKAKISATVNPYLRKRAVDFVEVDELFTSISDFVSTALAMLIEKLDYERELELKKSEDIERLRGTKEKEASHLLLEIIKNHPYLLKEISEMNIKDDRHELPKMTTQKIVIE